MTEEIVVVGGGPVGLWTAIQLKVRQPRLAVTVYERHAQYQRSHVLRLDHWSLILYGRHRGIAQTPRHQDFYREITGKSLSGLALAPTSSLFIRTNDLEAALKKYAADVGVTLVLRKVRSPEEVEALHPRCQRFIAADGAHSLMRRQLFGPDSEGLRLHRLQRVVEVKYQVRGTPARMGSFGPQLKANARLEHMAFEYVGKAVDGIAPVTLRFFVDEDTYAAMPGATFKEPLALDHPGVPAKLRADIATYMALRAGRSDEAFCQESARLTKLELSMYCARSFVHPNERRAWFLVGDAASGVPYFRALNSGLIMGSRLAQILGASSWPVCGKLSRQVLLYRVHRPLHVATEFAIARTKNTLLRGYDVTRQVLPASSLPSGNVKNLAKAVDCRDE